MRPISPTERVGDTGLTLLELLVSLTVVMLMIAAISGFIARTSDRDTTLRDIVGTLRLARTEAIAVGKEKDVIFDLSAQRYGIDAPDTAFANDLTIAVESARELRRTDTGQVIRFFPDGSSSGGRILVTHKMRNRPQVIDINWLTGVARHAP